MKRKNLYVRLFFKDIFLPLITAAFFIYINYYHIFVLNNLINYPYDPIEGEFTMLQISIGMVFYCFIFFLFSSYYFADKLRQSSLEECFRATKKGLPDFFGKHLMIFGALDLVIALTMTVYNVITYFVLKFEHTDVLIYSVVCIFFYIFCMSAIAILLGTFIAIKMMRLPACLCMALTAFLVSPLSESFASMMFYNFNINFYPIYEITNPIPRHIDARPNFHLGYSLLPYTVAAVIFYAALFTLPVLRKIFENRRVIKHRMTAALSAVCVLSAIVYVVPQDRMLAGENPEGNPAGDVLYYWTHLQKEEDGGFAAERYDMELKVINMLDAKVTVYVTEPDLPVYKFTLYHGYKVSKITDQSGAKLSFEYDGDYVEVTSGDSPVTSLTFSYSGISPLCFANAQGLFLFDRVPFFPQCGYKSVFDVDNQSFSTSLLERDAIFNVNFGYKKEVFSNLEKTGDNTFSGVSDGCVFVAGFVEEDTVNGISLAYPYTDLEQFSDSTKHEEMNAFIEYRTDNEDLKKIVILPVMTYGGFRPWVMYSDGTVVSLQVRTYWNEWTACINRAHKQKLRKLVYAYRNEKATFDAALDKELAEFDLTGDKGYAMLLTEAVERIGEDAILEAVDEYVTSKWDNRSVGEFLSAAE